MARKDSATPSAQAGRSPGHSICLLETGRDRGEAKAPREAGPEHLVLAGGDRFVATASGRRIDFYRYDDLADDGRPTCPLTGADLPAPVRQLVAHPGGQRTAVVAALDDGSLVECAMASSGPGRGCGEPAVRVLLDDLPGQLRFLVPARRSLLAVVDDGDSGGPMLIALDPGRRGQRRARLPLANLTSLTALDPERNDLLVAVDSRHGAHFVGFPSGQDGSTLEIVRVDPEVRATAAAALSPSWIVVARKGGELIQVRAAAASGGRDKTAELCRRIRHVLRLCGCECSDCRPGGKPGGGADPGRPDDGRPGGGRDPRRPHEDETCEEKQRAQLTWSVGRLQRVGRYLAAVAVDGKRMAVLDHNLNLLFERYLGASGAQLAVGIAGSDHLLTMRRGRTAIEKWSLDRYVASIREVDRPTGRRPGPGRVEAGTVTFRGHRSRPATPNPELKIAVFTVTEPGQPFGDPDQGKMQALLEPNVYDIVGDYYREISFQTVETVFDVFGVHIGTPRKPLVLPQSFASYFFDAFSPGGIRAVMPGDWTDPLTLDGTEAMTLHSEPAAGDGRDYAIPFAALWIVRPHNSYPVEVNFAGTETLQIDVEDQQGNSHTLNLDFAPLALSHGQGDDEAAFLQALGAYVTDTIRAAETAAGAPVVVQDVVFRRLRISDNDAEFGWLQGQFRIAASGAATQKGRLAIVPPGAPPAGLVALGLDGASMLAGVLGSADDIGHYLANCLHAARFDAGEGLGLNDPHLDPIVDRVEDMAAQSVIVTIKLAENKGGAGAEIGLVSSSGLADSGWSAAAPVAGSESNANNSNTMRHYTKLADDVFTAAMDHIRANGPWDPVAVNAQFAEYDGMMIGFVGACPATVPPADRWDSANAVDFEHKRMFVRRYRATDQNNPDPTHPVSMATELLIGQKFDKFDPGVMSHEVGHALGLPDLYGASGFRDDVVYIDDWCQMAGDNGRFNHFCAWSKWALGWIPESPDAALNRVVQVPMPDPLDITTIEAWLYPVEHGDNAMRADVEAEVGNGLPIGQMMKVPLGSDGGVFDIIELRSEGLDFSLQLPPTPAVIVTNVLDPLTDRRWAVHGLYRRSVHLLNAGRELRAVGDRFDFATSPEFPVKGVTVELMELRDIRGGSIPIARVKVVREPAEFIDLFFQDNIPSWRSPDIWVDWPGDNADPSVPRIYPEGTPTDQGETVRYPGGGVEPHFLVVRPHNAGSVNAEDVKVRWFVCDPPGAGDDGRWQQRDTQTIPQIDGGTWTTVPFIWNVDSGTNAHQCLRAEIIDWTIPAGVDPATGDTVALASDDVALQNNMAQKNVFDFEALT